MYWTTGLSMFGEIEADAANDSSEVQGKGPDETASDNANDNGEIEL